MQFSKYISDLARTHGIDQKDVLFAILITGGAAIPESFATVYRPTVSTSSALTSKASNYMGQRPGLKRLIKELDAQRTTTTNTDNEPSPAARRRGRPRKDDTDDNTNNNTNNKGDDRPQLDYTDKDAVLQELARIAERCEKESDRLAAIREISSLQRMKQEAAVEDEKRVTFYIPLTYERCDELLLYLRRFYAEKESESR